MIPNWKFHKIGIICVLVALCFLPSQAQNDKVLTLEECMQIALANNITVKLINNDAQIAAANEKQSKLEYLPRVSAFSNYNISRGLTNDPTTFEPVTATTKSSSPSVALDLNIFNGMRTRNIIRQSSIIKQSADFDVQQTKDNVELTVTALYLQVITDGENIKVSEERLELLSNQLKRAEQRVEAGVANMEQVYNLRSQVANENLNKVTLENQYKRGRLDLIQTLLLDPTEGYEFEDPEVLRQSIDTTLPSYQELLEAVLKYNPGLKSAGLNIESSKMDLALAKADRLPVLTMRAAYGSTFSSNQEESYFSQLDINEQRFLGFNLSIPIFDRNRVKNNIHVSKINIVNSELAFEQIKIDLINELQQAYLDLITAHSTYLAAQENLTAVEQSFRFAEGSYNSGNTDFYTYLESLNNKNRAEISLINSRYSYLFRKRILRIYRGL
ncbi:MAG: TolC family protein [Cyclobacteriaceae bacterium]|nr:TolC family protein [Cyclobacteriaceae bacterium]